MQKASYDGCGLFEGQKRHHPPSAERGDRSLRIAGRLVTVGGAGRVPPVCRNKRCTEGAMTRPRA